MLLQRSWDLAINSKDATVISIAQALDIEISNQRPELFIVYRVEAWPKIPLNVKCVKRDLKVSKADIGIDPNPKIGYFLGEQGRNGANMTERYLNRNAPRGKGLADPMIVLVWGRKK
jgi:hypothetical protein